MRLFSTVIAGAIAGLTLAACAVNTGAPEQTASTKEAVGVCPLPPTTICPPGEQYDPTTCECEPVACCPLGWDMYTCIDTDDKDRQGLNCHNPALGCASSLICGQGCDFEVTGRCPVCDPIVCPPGETFDSILCKCIP
jgi:hypothetical protein